ncbi:phospholipase C [Gluconobacter frateurii M-2]|nr:phospholipase C [Gluconobacter frateurii M-2]
MVGPEFFIRRRLLSGAARAASLAAASTVLSAPVKKLLAVEPRRLESLRQIKHVVLLMQENRSFDHYFGSLAGVRGFSDPAAMILGTGKNVFHQPDDRNPKGYLLPFHLDTKTTNAQTLPSTSHAWDVQHQAWNGGKMDGWASAHRAADGVNGPFTMGYFKRDDIPFHYALAEAFTICDSYHCSVLGPTGPNRLYYMSGTIDADGRSGGPATGNPVSVGGYRWTTYPERLEEAGVSWRVYQHGDRGVKAYNALTNFTRFMDAPTGSLLAKRGVPEASDGEFEYDVLHDQLPTVSWLLPGLKDSEHPDRMPAAGADFIARKLNGLAANPDVWAKTIFILNYDENDGLFDHVPPPVPPVETPDEFVGGMPIGAGFRVPCIVISPWTMGGWVCSQPLDHTSVLRFLERLTGVREPNISGWRRRTFGDFFGAFHFDASASAMPSLPETAASRRQARLNVSQLPSPSIPGAVQTIPEQEKVGSRRKSR